MDTSLGHALRTYHGSTPLPSISYYLLNQKLVLPARTSQTGSSNQPGGRLWKALPIGDMGGSWIHLEKFWSPSDVQHFQNKVEDERERKKLEWYFGVTAVSSNLA